MVMSISMYSIGRGGRKGQRTLGISLSKPSGLRRDQRFCHTETRCLRTIPLDHYKEPSHFRGGTWDPSWCCSICNLELAIPTYWPTIKERQGRPKASTLRRSRGNSTRRVYRWASTLGILRSESSSSILLGVSLTVSCWLSLQASVTSASLPGLSWPFPSAR
jgi:hypothetical protein